MVMGAPQATQIANVVDISKLKAKVNVAEKDVLKLHVGDAVDISTDLFPQIIFPEVCSRFHRKGTTRYLSCGGLLEQSKLLLKAGMFVSVTFKPKSSRQPRFLFPREALVGSLQDAKVYVVKDNIAKLRPVSAVRSGGYQYGDFEGSRRANSVVVDGQDNLSDNVSVVVRKQ